MHCRAARAGLVVLLALCGWSCGPQCQRVTPKPTSVCRETNAGQVEAGVPFVVLAEPPLIGGECQVSVDGGQIDLVIAGTSCTGSLGGGARPVPPSRARCSVPALPAGTYSVNGTTFAVPQSASAALPACL